MKQAYYFTFSRGHVHSVNGFTFDKDVVVVIHAETENKAREIMCAHFGREWGFCYHKKPDMDFFPRGLKELKMKTAIELIAEERQRQIEVEGYTPDHDDQHGYGELAMAAMCYAMLPIWRPAEMAPLGWPWSSPEPMNGFKPTPDDRIRELVKAAALCVAEIERLQRQLILMKFKPIDGQE